jgi:tetratricopeptide (TPR) repeat protein
MRWSVLACLVLGCRSGTTTADEHAGQEQELARGIELVERGDLEAGIEILRAMLDEASADPALCARARSWIGAALTRAGDPEGALRECQQALELAPHDPWLHYACGVAWYTMGELEPALEAFTRGVESDPRHIKCLQWRGLVRRDLDDDRTAIEDLTRAIECIESADDSALSSWGGERRTLMVKSLSLRLQAFDDLGMHDAAMRDRARLAALLEGE